MAAGRPAGPLTWREGTDHISLRVENAVWSVVVSIIDKNLASCTRTQVSSHLLFSREKRKRERERRGFGQARIIMSKPYS